MEAGILLFLIQSHMDYWSEVGVGFWEGRSTGTLSSLGCGTETSGGNLLQLSTWPCLVYLVPDIFVPRTTDIWVNLTSNCTCRPKSLVPVSNWCPENPHIWVHQKCTFGPGSCACLWLVEPDQYVWSCLASDVEEGGAPPSTCWETLEAPKS